MPDVRALTSRVLRRARARQVTLASLCFLLPLAAGLVAARGADALAWERVGLDGQQVVQVIATGDGAVSAYWALVEQNGVWMSVAKDAPWRPWSTGLPRGTWGEIRADAVAATSLSSMLLALSDEPGTASLYRTDIEGVWRLQHRVAASGRTRAILTSLGDSWLYLVTARELYQSGDGGESWGSALSWGEAVASAVAVDPHNPQRLLLGTNTGDVLASDDGGRTWELRMTLPLQRQIRDLAMPAGRPGIVWMAAGASVYRSEDYGRTWLPRRNGLGSGFATSLLVDPASASTIFAGMDPGGVYLSTDEGATWDEFRTGLGPLGVHDLALDPGDLTTLLAATDDGIWAIDLVQYRPGVPAPTWERTTETPLPRPPTATERPAGPTVATPSPTRGVTATPTATETLTATPTGTATRVAATETPEAQTTTPSPTPSPTATAPRQPPPTAVPPTATTEPPPSPTSPPASVTPASTRPPR